MGARHLRQGPARTCVRSVLVVAVVSRRAVRRCRRPAAASQRARWCRRARPRCRGRAAAGEPGRRARAGRRRHGAVDRRRRHRARCQARHRPSRRSAHRCSRCAAVLRDRPGALCRAEARRAAGARWICPRTISRATSASARISPRWRPPSAKPRPHRCDCAADRRAAFEFIRTAPGVQRPVAQPAQRHGHRRSHGHPGLRARRPAA